MIETQQAICAGGVVLNNEGLVLVTNQKHRSWSLPKGHVDDGEHILEAARREVYEETGVSDLTVVKPLGSYGRYKTALDGGDDLSEYKTIHMFLFHTSQIALNPVDPENPEAQWVAKEHVAAQLTHAKDKAFFLSILPELES